MTYSKYNARRITRDGHTFASTAEYLRYLQLCDELERGEITKLILQPKFVLIKAFTDQFGNRERALTYKPDFQYERDGQTCVEDVKGAVTRDYQIRRKLFRMKFSHIRFIEVRMSS